MAYYDFYLEFDGKTTKSNIYQAAFTQIRAGDVKTALRKFSEQNKLKLDTYDILDDGSYRAFLHKKAFLKTPVNYIFHLKLSQEESALPKEESRLKTHHTKFTSTQI